MMIRKQWGNVVAAAGALTMLAVPALAQNAQQQNAASYSYDHQGNWHINMTEASGQLIGVSSVAARVSSTTERRARSRSPTRSTKSSSIWLAKASRSTSVTMCSTRTKRRRPSRAADPSGDTAPGPASTEAPTARTRHASRHRDAGCRRPCAVP